MNAPQFRTPEVKNLYDELRGWDHPDYPFLDPSYSPGSYAPATDFTPYIAAWLATDRVEAVQELWSYITRDYEASHELLRTALRLRRPASIEMADWQWQELRAVYLLALRVSLLHNANDGAYLISKLASVIIACEPISLERESMERLLRATQREVRDDSPCDATRGRAGAALFAVEKAQQPLGIVSEASALLRQVSPMTRHVVNDYCTRGWNEGKFRFHLYYGERMYGCCTGWNQHFTAWLGFFKHPDDDGHVPASVTKEMLRAALAQHGLESKKSEGRDTLLQKVRQVPALLASLIEHAEPGQQELRAEWEDAVKEWSQRVRAVEAAATGLVKLF
jgi:hypothetical protein